MPRAHDDRVVVVAGHCVVSASYSDRHAPSLARLVLAAGKDYLPNRRDDIGDVPVGVGREEQDVAASPHDFLAPGTVNVAIVIGPIAPVVKGEAVDAVAVGLG